MQYLQSVRGDENYLKYLAKLKRVNLIILDDFGVSPLKAIEARDLLVPQGQASRKLSKIEQTHLHLLLPRNFL
jgi:DNA replication protein DnaC